MKRFGFVVFFLLIACTLFAVQLDGSWLKLHDLTLDGYLDEDSGETYLAIETKNGELSAVYEGADYTPSRKFYDFTISPSKYDMDVITFWYADSTKPNYYAVFSGLIDSDGIIVGTWYDTRGNAGDFGMVQVPGGEESYVGGTYSVQAMDGYHLFQPSYSSIVLSDNPRELKITVVQGESGTEGTALKQVGSDGVYIITSKYFYDNKGSLSDKDTGIHAIIMGGVDSAHPEYSVFNIVPGLNGEGVSFESEAFPGFYIRALNDGRQGGYKKLYLQKASYDSEYKRDASFMLFE